jgi:hypothetical protein
MLHRSDSYAKRFSHLASVTAASAPTKDKELPPLMHGSSKVQTGHRRKQEQQPELEPISRHPNQVTPSAHATAVIQKLLVSSSSSLPPAPHRTVDLATAPASGTCGFIDTRCEHEPNARDV